MVRIAGGTYAIGTDTPPPANVLDGEAPRREVTLAPFSIDPTAVTNAQFAAFADATGHVTDAERLGWSFVFEGLLGEGSWQRVVGATWWCAVPGATWRHPQGPGSAAEDDHPVVHVSLEDARAYARWRGARLPTEAEWEVAARGGLDGARYPWGDELLPDGEWRCNIWQGDFPVRNTLEDGYLGTAPVRAYPPNGYGLYEMTGNVWEWVEGGVRKGGSYLCHDSYCSRYRVSARTQGQPDDATGNIGFRCASSLGRTADGQSG